MSIIGLVTDGWRNDAARLEEQLREAKQQNAALRAALMETLRAMVDLEAKSLRHHRYREPLLTALTMRAGIDKILKAIRKHPEAALVQPAPAENSGDVKEQPQSILNK